MTDDTLAKAQAEPARKLGASSKTHQVGLLSGNRLHLSEGPIDLVIWADGEPEDVARAYRAAERRFDGLLAELCTELPLLRTPLASELPALKGPIARRMAEACWPHRAVYITPMAAVAGAVAEAVLAAMVQSAPLARAYVNDGGDIALHLTPSTSLVIGGVRSLEKAVPEGEVTITHAMPIRGIATSGRHGRSFSLGIADAVTVLARDAPSADAAATLIANAVDIEHPGIVRRPARDLDADSDLGDLPVVVDVGPLAPAQIAAALDAGVARAEMLRRAGLIEAALLTLAGEWRSVGGGPCRGASRAVLGWIMIKVLEQAIEKIKELPEDRQAYAAEVLEQIAAADADVFQVPDDRRAAILEGLEQAKRGEFVSDEEMAALWKKVGL